MSDEEFEQRIRSVRAEVNDYLETVQGLIALSHELRWDNDVKQIRPESSFTLGRRMTTSGRNRIQPNQDVTPDLTVQPYAGYGIVAEARLRFPSDEAQRMEKVRQLQKYDDDLEGWNTLDGTVERSDVVLMTHDDDVIKTTDYIEQAIADGRAAFSRDLSIIGCIRTTERYGNEAIRVRKAYGGLSDERLDDRLRNGRSIRLGTLSTRYSMELYDQRPPPAHMLSVMWMTILPVLVQEDQYIRARGEGPPLVRITAEDLTARMRKALNPSMGAERSPGYPQQAWVREALDDMCRLRYAKRLGDEYEVAYRVIRDPQETFIKGVCRLEREREKRESKRALKQTPQLKLFD